MNLLASYLLLFSLSIASASANSLFEEIKKIKNDKEVEISSFSKKEQERIRALYFGEEFRADLGEAFYATMAAFAQEEPKRCELNLIERWVNKLNSYNMRLTEEKNEDLLKLLRVDNYIDDILYEIMSGASADYFAFQKIDYKKDASFQIAPSSRALKNNDASELFENFYTWPDESTLCSYSEYLYTKNNVYVSWNKKTQKKRHYKTLLKEALNRGAIDLTSYHRLKRLRLNSYINDYYIGLDDYLEIVLKAKNKLVPLAVNRKPIDIELENKFPSERIARFSDLTQRKLLYEKYDPTQIIMLAQVLQKASKRMGSDPDTNSGPMILTQEFEVLMANGERQNYVERLELDPQSQYNLARRRMRKDILDLQMMDTFHKTKITYYDIIMAALETGYITHEDVDFVAKYDDLWNPTKSKWEKISGLIFNIAGYATFFVPPPWNVVASIAMGITEGVIDNKHFRDGTENDNPSTFIE